MVGEALISKVDKNRFVSFYQAQIKSKDGQLVI